MTDQSDQIDWRYGTLPVSRRFDDPFYSLQDGWAEARHVFLGGNDLPARFCPGFHIAELGFGTGLNLAAVLAARPLGLPLRYTSFEAYPLPPATAVRALHAFPAAAGTTQIIAEVLSAPGPISHDGVEITLVRGDARQTLPVWQGAADAWFLDGFAPAKNPELWEPGLLAEVARHTRASGTCATYTAAGAVRRALAAAGFQITRAPGFGRKRHMTRGVLG